MKKSGNVAVGIMGAALAGVVVGIILGQRSENGSRHAGGDTDEAVAKLWALIKKGRKKYNEMKLMLNERSAQQLAPTRARSSK